MNGSRQLLPAGAGERDIDTARFLEGSTLLSLQFNVGVQAASPSGKERLPRTSTSVQAAGVEPHQTLQDMLPPPNSLVHCPCQHCKCRRGMGWVRPMLAQSGGCCPWRTPGADGSKTAES